MTIINRNWLAGLLAVVMVISIAGCGGGDSVREDQPYPPYGSDSGMDDGSSTSGIDRSRLNERGLQGVQRSDRERFLDPNDPLSTRVFYFDFDSDVVRSEYRASVKAHAEYASRTGATIRLEGHTDERGTREYNVGLGERRAKAVQRLLSAHGVPASNLRVLSFGEERPQELGHNESAWSKNRRVEIIYEK